MFKKLLIYSLSLLFCVICLAENIETLEKNDAVFIANEKANQGLFNPVEYSSFKGYRGEGGFVEGPARVGDWTGYIIGALPAAVITEPFRLVPVAGYEGNNIGEYTLYGTTKTFGCLFGGLPFICKSAFYDFPVWVFSSGGKEKPDAALVASKAEKQKILEEIERIESKKWDTEDKHQFNISSISIKPKMLKINEEALIAKGLIPDPEKVNEQKGAQSSETSTKTVFSKNQSEDLEKSTGPEKGEAPAWDSSLGLPDWVKQEMEKQ